MSLKTSIPVYVTRETADGLTGSWSMSAWIPLLVMLLVAANAVGWGIYGLVVLIEKAVA